MKWLISKIFYVTIFVLYSISFQLLLRFMCSELRLYFVSVSQNISVSISVLVNEIMLISVLVSISVNEYITAFNRENPAATCMDR